MSITPDPVQTAEEEVALAEEHLAAALHPGVVVSGVQAPTSPPLVEPAMGSGGSPVSSQAGSPLPSSDGDVVLASALPFRAFRASDGTLVTWDGVKISATLAGTIESEAAACGFALRKV